VRANTDLEAARDAVARQDWAAAYEAFQAADRGVLSGPDLEAFADSAWWMGHLQEAIQIRTEAYAAFDADGNDARAGWVAGRLAIEYFLRGEAAIGSGFLMRAQRHAAVLPDGREQGFVAVLESTIALNTGDPQGAADRAVDAIRIARASGDPELTAVAVHCHGMALIALGRAPEGLALLDEAMAGLVAGQVGPHFTGIIYCNLIGTCLSMYDIGRAGQWSDAARDWCATIPARSAFTGMCRANRAEVARLRGAWAEAEAEATRACEELMDVEPGIAAAAFLQLAEVTRRQGDLTRADQAYARAHELGEDPQPGLALLRLAQGKVAAAQTAIEIALAGPSAAPHRARLLAARVEIGLAQGDVDGARVAAEELSAITRDADTPAFMALADTAVGSVALAERDVAEAIARLRAATARWHEQRLPYENARARVLYADALRAAGDDDGAALELRAALAIFERLGAVAEQRATQALLGDGSALPGGLTAREAEVLRLVASGKTDRDIAVELVISEHTVGRHLQNMYAKLGVTSRAGATAFAFEHALN
jgi:DNA-binding NarL/FixJ family response regulator